MTLLAGLKAMVVCRFTDHRMLKGVALDFHANKSTFHLVSAAEPNSPPVEIPLSDLKAVFFVKDYSGNPEHVSPQDFDGARGQGRRVKVTFKDGELLNGFTLGYNAAASGFFVVPADPESNNARVFVINASVQSLTWG